MSTQTDLRRAILTRLRSDPTLTALVPAARIYPPQAPPMPAYPFVLYGRASETPLRATGMNGTSYIGAVHAFSQSASGEGEADAIASRIRVLLDGPDGRGVTLRLPNGGAAAHLRWTGTQMLGGAAEQDDWHAVVNFAADATW